MFRSPSEACTELEWKGLKPLERRIEVPRAGLNDLPPLRRRAYLMVDNAGEFDISRWSYLFLRVNLAGFALGWLVAVYAPSAASVAFLLLLSPLLPAASIWFRQMHGKYAPGVQQRQLAFAKEWAGERTKEASGILFLLTVLDARGSGRNEPYYRLERDDSLAILARQLSEMLPAMQVPAYLEVRIWYLATGENTANLVRRPAKETECRFDLAAEALMGHVSFPEASYELDTTGQYATWAPGQKVLIHLPKPAAGHKSS